MTAVPQPAPWRVRVATDEDASLLAAFRCCTSGHVWDIEVEQFIREDLLTWTTQVSGALAEFTDARTLLLLDRLNGDLLAVGAHERRTLTLTTGDTLTIRHIEVIAVSDAWQGRAMSDGNRPSDIIMSAVLQDILNQSPGQVPVVTVLVHRDNTRSQALARRYGMTRPLSPATDEYLRLSTEPV